MRAKTGRVLKRAYRDDDSAQVMWQAIASRETDTMKGVGEQTSQMDQCRIEYLTALVEVGEHYSVAVPGDDAVAPPKRLHFELVQVKSSRHRDHLMPTVESRGDISLTAALAFQVGYAQERMIEHAASAPPLQPDMLELFSDGELERMRPFSLVPFSAHQATLLQYKLVWPSTNEGCYLVGEADNSLCYHGCAMPRLCYHASPQLIWLDSCEDSPSSHKSYSTSI